MEAIQEFTLQTSNFAPEFGVVTGGLYNFTSRSGTNQLHGSGYIYLQNTAFNAGLPFTDNGQGGHVQIVKHLADGGFSVGGPVFLPKIYTGRIKHFSSSTGSATATERISTTGSRRCRIGLSNRRSERDSGPQPGH